MATFIQHRFAKTTLFILGLLSGGTSTPAIAQTSCEFQATGTAAPPTSGTPVVISETTGTIISANFFNSGAIDPIDGNEFVSICVSPPDTNGDRSARITSDVGRSNNFQIKAYPQFVVGSKFGNIFETSFRYYNNAGLPDKDQWPVTSDKLSNQNTPFEFANLEYISNVRGIGLPAFTNDLPTITITLDIDEENVIGAERDIMLESWFYDTSANAQKIGSHVATGLPIANTLNNIVGIGHPHYNELDNTLLEMMVHIGALSGNDVSNARNNPGQNQLTEIFSGKDYDLDGIDDHFDVDSHAFLNSDDALDPNPGIYSSGIDNNGDGIDDGDILPVQMGSHLYSIWYGESFLSPIVIYSRETDSSLKIDFNPETPDMDLTNEGEIQLPWNEFLDFTLNEVQPMLQAESVDWASGNNNIFTKMSASSGAIGGVEFGVEPQINNALDQTYEMTVNTFQVLVDGTPLGLGEANDKRDTDAPVSNNLHPLSGESIPVSSSVSGTASDTGGSGINEVRVAIFDRDSRQWYSFETGTFGSWSFATASLSNTTATDTQWSIDTELPPGEYTLNSLAFDNAGNHQIDSTGTNSWTKTRFSISAIDSTPPTSVNSPAQSGETLPRAPTLTGTASDTGGSGFDEVRVAIFSQTSRQYYSFATDTFGSWSFAKATLSNTTTDFTDWSIDTRLPPGEYTLWSLAIDQAGNRIQNNAGVNTWTKTHFSIRLEDTAAPLSTNSINSLLTNSPVLNGTASDSGGSGFDSVRIAILNRENRQWYSIDSDEFGGWSFATAELSNTTNEFTDWSIETLLPPGEYTLWSIAIDNNGNRNQNINGGNSWTKTIFSIAEN